MSLETSLQAWLSSRLTVKDRVYPMNLPQSPGYPALTFQAIDTQQGYNSDGEDLSDSLIQFDCWARTFAEADALAEEVKTLFRGWVRANIGDADVQAVFLEGRRPLYEAVGQGIWHVQLDLSFSHS